jgi:transcriptional regulator with XRE-family HTH domain
MYIPTNLLLLRKHKKRTQDEIAFAIGITRYNYVKYEKGTSSPPLLILVALSDYFKVSLDHLIRVDLSKLSTMELYQLENEHMKGASLRVLPTMVGEDGMENIELVTEKAKAGYLAGYADPDYIGQLPTFRLPFLNQQRKYRAFPVSGDSMLPIPDGAVVVGEYLVDWHELKTGEAYIFLTREDGIVFKLVEEESIRRDGRLQLKSQNPLYKSYPVHISEVMEVWKFSLYLSSVLPEEIVSQEELVSLMRQVHQEVEEIKMFVKK